MNSAVFHASKTARWVRPVRPLLWAATLLAGIWSGGCAAVSNPVEDAIPVNRLPPEVIGQRKDEEKTIPLQLLRQKPPDIYRLGPGDVLGVFIEGVLGDPKQPPPVHYPEAGSSLQPAAGLPIPVREDGTISLPDIPPLKVEGRSLVEAQNDIVKAYAAKNIKTERMIVSLIKERQYHIIVVRQDSGGLTVAPQGGGIGQTKRGTGYVVDLPAYDNDVLHALARTGGLPGLDAENAVTVERASVQNFDNKDALLQQVEQCRGRGQSIHIPMRLRPDEPPPFKPEDVILQNGDIVFIEARDTELFYTGGLLPSHQFILPRDYDLDVVQAVAFASGPFFNGNQQQNNLSGAVVIAGLGFPSPSLVTILRRTPGGGQIPIKVNLNTAMRDPRERVLIQPNDIIILQETLDETLTRYVTTQLRFNFLGTIIRQNDLIGTANLNLP